MRISGILLIVIILIFNGCGGLFSGGMAPTLKQPLTSGTRVDVKSSDGLIWSFEPSVSFIEEYYVFDEFSKPAIKEVFSGDLFVLLPEDYETFKSMEAQHQCPASFLNSSAIVIPVLTEKTEIVNKLKTLKPGNKITIEGYDVDYSVSTGDGDGIDFNLDGKAHPVYLEKIEVSK